MKVGRIKQLTHTPGPWFQSHREQPDGMWTTQVYDSNGESIADIAWYPVRRGNVTATSRSHNAALIAAAPELLAALKLVVLHFKRNHASGNFQGDDEHEAWREAEDAIAKAEGKP